MDDSQLIPKRLLTYNMGATKFDELEETSVCSRVSGSLSNCNAWKKLWVKYNRVIRIKSCD